MALLNKHSLDLGNLKLKTRKLRNLNQDLQSPGRSSLRHSSAPSWTVRTCGAKANPGNCYSKARVPRPQPQARARASVIGKMSQSQIHPESGSSFAVICEQYNNSKTRCPPIHKPSIFQSVHPSVNPYIHPSILLIGVFVEKGQGMGALAVALVLWPKVAFAWGGHAARRPNLGSNLHWRGETWPGGWRPWLRFVNHHVSRLGGTWSRECF